MFKGLQFNLIKGMKYLANEKYEIENDPIVIVDCYDENGVFQKKEVHTVAQVLEDVEKYDQKTFWMLINRLSVNSYGDENRVNALYELIGELKKRFDEEKKRREETKETPIEPMENNWDKKRRYFFGKSLKA
jgi:hypothetical protein